MSRIGKKLIQIPNGVTVKVEGDLVLVKGPLGEIKRRFNGSINITIEDSSINLKPTRNSKAVKALWGTYASHLVNMISGVTKGFEKKLLIEGIGYRAQIEGKQIRLNVGFSHPIVINIPDGIAAKTEKNLISVSGVDKEKVGQFSADIRSARKPEPYKGKGIRYENEVVRRKAGKKVTTTA
ncbi:MAG TPA: 50S ribosomal protein L6, partial [Candidatus Paceibacterota bacterium]